MTNRPTLGQVADMLDKHKAWVNGEPAGVRSGLKGATLAYLRTLLTAKSTDRYTPKV